MVRGETYTQVRDRLAAASQDRPLDRGGGMMPKRPKSNAEEYERANRLGAAFMIGVMVGLILAVLLFRQFS